MENMISITEANTRAVAAGTPLTVRVRRGTEEITFRVSAYAERNGSVKCEHKDGYWVTIPADKASTTMVEVAE